MDRAQQDATTVARDQAKREPPPERQAMRKALRGVEGFDAQSAALTPPEEQAPTTPGGPQTPKPAADQKTPAPTDTKTSEAKTPAASDAKTTDAKTTAPSAKTPAPVEADSEVEVPEEAIPEGEVAPPAQAEMAKLTAAADAVAKPKGDDAGASKKPAKGKGKEAPTGGGGVKKTHGPEDIVATYGTVGEAAKRQTHINAYWVKGLETVKDEKGHKHKQEKDQVETLDMETSSIPVHEKLGPLFTEIFEEIKNSGDWQNILERPWATNARQNRNKPTEWSVHSWGTAIDVNPTTNPNAPGAKDYSPSVRQSKIQKHFTSRGFVWLKDSDAMHFQYHTGGTPKISDAEIEQIISDDGKKERNKTFPGTSRESLTRDTKAKIKLKNGERKKVQKLLDKAKAGTPPTNPKKLKKYEAKIAKLEANLAAIDWWIAQFQAIVDKLAGKVPLEVGGAADVAGGPAGAAAEPT